MPLGHHGGFFSSRRRHTRYIGDWSSDVCSSDLENARRDAMEVDDAAVRERLVLSYGSRWRSVWALGAEAPALRERLSPAHTVIAAEMVHGVTREMAMTLGDLLIRRTHLAF